MTFLELTKRMVKTYGVNSCFDNIDEENTLEDEGIWFECPHCGEPLLMEDWTMEEIYEDGGCPICGEEFEVL